MRPVSYRWLLAIGTPLAVLIVAELVLQVGSLAVRAGTREMPRNWLTDRTRVLAVGDSNTFGLYLDEHESYPAQLEAGWNARYPDRAIEILNFGYPGMNSFRILDNLDGLLRKFRPDVVLLTVGVNDVFTPVEDVDVGGRGFSLQAWIAEHSRLYRLLHMLRQSRREPAPIEVEQRRIEWVDDEERLLQRVGEFKEANEGAEGEEVLRVGDEEFVAIRLGEAANNLDSLPANLERIHGVVERYGAELYLLTYAASQTLYRQSNRAMRRYAARSGAALIDVARFVKRRCPEADACPELFFDDLHPRARGYAMVADAVIERLAHDWSLDRSEDARVPRPSGSPPRVGPGPERDRDPRAQAVEDGAM